MSTATAEKTIPTPEEIRQSVADVARRIGELTFHREYTIEDYPIGRRDRGKCKLEVEYSKSKGLRTVRTTTNNRGQWCAPKKSTYRERQLLVVVSGDLEHETAWLNVGIEGGVYLCWANGDCESWLKSPYGFGRPRREPHHYTMQSRVYSRGLDQPPVVTNEPRTLPADSPELCDAYDAYVEAMRPLLSFVLDKMKQLS